MRMHVPERDAARDEDYLFAFFGTTTYTPDVPFNDPLGTTPFFSVPRPVLHHMQGTSRKATNHWY